MEEPFMPDYYYPLGSATDLGGGNYVLEIQLKEDYGVTPLGAKRMIEPGAGYYFVECRGLVTEFIPCKSK